MTSPTQRSLKLLRDAGYHAAITEHWNQYARIRQDLFGFCDIVAFKASGPVLLVQTTTQSNQSARVAKIVGNDIARAWMAGENRGIIVHGWRKVGAKGSRKLWECRVVQITAADFTCPTSDIEDWVSEVDAERQRKYIAPPTIPETL
jgi:hypothetical protein